MQSAIVLYIGCEPFISLFKPCRVYTYLHAVFYIQMLLPLYCISKVVANMFSQITIRFCILNLDFILRVIDRFISIKKPCIFSVLSYGSIILWIIYVFSGKKQWFPSISFKHIYYHFEPYIYCKVLELFLLHNERKVVSVLYSCIRSIHCDDRWDHFLNADRTITS